MNKYKNIYFDLDRTIWDFDKNAMETFRDIFEKYELENIFNNFNDFYNTYVKHNDNLWGLYREGKIEKSVLSYKRFWLTLNEFGVDDGPRKSCSYSKYITNHNEK